jgi:hypothetical protein
MMIILIGRRTAHAEKRNLTRRRRICIRFRVKRAFHCSELIELREKEFQLQRMDEGQVL